MNTPKSSAEDHTAATEHLPDGFSWSMVDPLGGRPRASITHEASGISINIPASALQPVCLAIRAFAGIELAPSNTDWKSELPEEYRQSDEILLRRTILAVDQRSTHRVLGDPSDHPEGRIVPAYTIEVSGQVAGHVIVLDAKRFLLSAPELSPGNSTHTGLRPAAQRIEMLLTYPKPSDNETSPPSPS